MTCLEGPSPLSVRTIPSVDSTKEVVQISYTEPSPSPDVKDIPSPSTGEEEAAVSDRQLLHPVDPERARQLVSRLSTKEQVSLLAAADFWRTVALPEHGIPAIKTTDGPNGARGEFFTDGTPAALFPAGVSLASSWDPALIYEVGKHLAEETKARGADVLLGPTICMHRSPLGGRNFESFSEDPYLTGKLAAAYVQGLQSKGIAATPKHFIANEQETWRTKVDSIVAVRPLREIYLKPFEIAVREGRPWALMTSYNLVNGTHADMNEYLIQNILRGEWEYDGLVMSDWKGTNSVAESIKAGCDIEMPGPTMWRGERALQAIEAGLLSKDDVERCATNVLYLVDRVKGLGNLSPEPAERIENTPERRDLIRKAGQQGLTLLKNEQSLLPISKDQKIAMIGPNGKRAIVHGGGSASLKPYYAISPFDGLQSQLAYPLRYAQGCDTFKWLPLMSLSDLRSPSGKAGVQLEYYSGDRFKGEPFSVQHRNATDLFLWDAAPSEIQDNYSFKVRGTLKPATTGRHTISFMSVGPARIYVNGKLLIDNWDWTEEGEAMFDGSVDVLRDLSMHAGEAYEIYVESTNEYMPAAKRATDGITHKYGGCRIGFQEAAAVNLQEEAVQLAKEVDVVVMVVGVDAEWESEGYDRQTMDLPSNGSQDRLIEAVVAANPNTVVVNQSGTPVTMPWADRVPAIVQAWYQGQEAGNALADVLLGKVNPSGKLPTTFPKRLEDNPAWHNWPGENYEVVYGEGIFIGYRHYERAKIEPQFAFGHGLSYTTFAYGQPSISSTVMNDDETLTITIPITNTGSRTGAEIVQAYVRDLKSSVPRPEKELQAFSRIELEAGETETVQLSVDKYSIGYYSTKHGQWLAEEGEFEVHIGASSVDIRANVKFEVQDSFTWVF